MTFPNNLDELMEFFNIKNIDLANRSGISQAYISKLRRGLRVPKNNSDAYGKIYMALLEILSEDEIASMEFLESLSSFKVWIYRDVNSISGKFVERLNLLIEFFGVRNSEIAKGINVDPSIISRYRTGARLPSINNININNLAEFFAKLIVESSGVKDFESSFGIVLRDQYSVEYIKKKIYEYLVDYGESISFLNSIFEKVNSFNSEEFDPSSVLKAIEQVHVPKNETIKRKGLDGLRELVIKFLCLVASSESKQLLKLFSNQSMEWLTEDREFFNTWKMLMCIVLTRGHRIKIIHYFSRPNDEIINAIEGWIPLHIIGNIESYSSTSLPLSMFSNTLFICSNNFLVMGSTIIGLEDSTEYYFSRDKHIVESSESAFDELILNGDKVLDSIPINSYFELIHLIKSSVEKTRASKTYYIHNKPPYWNLSDENIFKIIEKNGLNEIESEKLKSYFTIRRETYQSLLKNRMVIDCFYINEDYKKPDFIENIYFSESSNLTYEADDYCAQLQGIKDALLTYENYGVIILRDQIFKNIDIIEVEGETIFIVKVNHPISVLQYSNRTVVDKFNYYRDFRFKNSLNSWDNFEEVIDLLSC